MPVRKLSAELKGTATVFAALGDRIRLLLVARLASGDALSITQLAAGTRVTRQAVTKHLHVLAGASVVRGFRQGREQLWELNPEQLREARRSLDTISHEWEAALGRLKSKLED
jgi:DNA-binding transcriptional ArsR family regulator